MPELAYKQRGDDRNLDEWSGVEQSGLLVGAPVSALSPFHWVRLHGFPRGH